MKKDDTTVDGKNELFVRGVEAEMSTKGRKKA